MTDYLVVYKSSRKTSHGMDTMDASVVILGAGPLRPEMITTWASGLAERLPGGPDGWTVIITNVIRFDDAPAEGWRGESNRRMAQYRAWQERHGVANRDDREAMTPELIELDHFHALTDNLRDRNES